MKNVCYLVILASLIGCGKEKIKEVKGTDGISCYTETMDTGTMVICGDTESFIPNGLDGIDGVDGDDADLEYVTVCPDIPGSYPEVLLKLDDKYLAYFAKNGDAKKSRLVVLDDGTYKTTDGRNVYFEISGSDLICH